MDKLIWECDIVFHFAALVGVHHYVERPYNVLDVNVNGTKLVADLAYQYGKKMVFASTSEVYGRSTKIPFAEDDDRVLGSTKVDRWCYSTSKAVGEHYCFPPRPNAPGRSPRGAPRPPSLSSPENR